MRAYADVIASKTRKATRYDLKRSVTILLLVCLVVPTLEIGVPQVGIDCVPILNTDGNPSVDGVTCVCNAGYTWNNNICEGDCTTAHTASSTLQVDGTCPCASGFVWNNAAAACWIDCTTPVNTDDAATTDGITCNCNSGYTWSTTNYVCEADCTTPNTRSSTPQANGTCSCEANYVWNNVAATCWIDCANLVNTDGAASADGSACVCAAPSKMVWSSPTCGLTCSSLLNNDNTDGGATCNCNSGYTWSTTNYVCEADCAADTHASPQNPIADGTCTCATHFIYDNTNARCQIDCSTVTNASPSAGPTFDTCTCVNSTFTFNSATLSCGIDCTTVIGSTGVKINDTTCKCRSGYKWNSATSVCDPVCGSLRYSLLSDGNGGCTCNTNFLWNADRKQCVIDCTAYAATKPAATTESYNQCECRDHFEWMEEKGTYDPTLLGCKIKCSEDSYSTGADPANPNLACLCKTGFSWNSTFYRCQIVCTASTYNTGIASSTTSCKCVTNTYWNSTSQACELICSKISNTNGAAAVNGVCVCKTGYVWNSLTLKCARLI